MRALSRPGSIDGAASHGAAISDPDAILSRVSPFRRLLAYVARYRRAFLLGLICSFVTTGHYARRAARSPARDRRSDGRRHRRQAGALRRRAARHRPGRRLFRFWTRRILDRGVARSSNTTCGTTSSRTCETLPLAYFQANRTGDLMSRATNDLNAVRMMIGPSIMYSANTLLTFVAALAMMLAIDAAADAALAHSAAVRLASRSRYFGSAIHKRLRADPGAALRGQRGGAGGARPASASFAPIGRKQPSSSVFGGQPRTTCGAIGGSSPSRDFSSPACRSFSGSARCWCCGSAAATSSAAASRSASSSRSSRT